MIEKQMLEKTHNSKPKPIDIPSAQMPQNPLLVAVEFMAGQLVRCVKADPMDEHCGIENKNRWHIGDEFIVESVDEFPWGIFLNDGKGHDLNARRAIVVS